MSIRSSLFLPFLLLLIFSAPEIASAQQMNVDDATIAENHLLES